MLFTVELSKVHMTTETKFMMVEATTAELALELAQKGWGECDGGCIDITTFDSDRVQCPGCCDGDVQKTEDCSICEGTGYVAECMSSEDEK